MTVQEFRGKEIIRQQLLRKFLKLVNVDNYEKEKFVKRWLVSNTTLLII